MESSYNAYKIIQFQEKYIPHIKKLYYYSYGRKKPLNYFKYRLSKTPYGKPIILLMKYKDEIIAFYAIYPLVLKISKRNYLGGYSYLTMTHPSHSGKGIFNTLATKTYEIAEKKGYNFIITFANANSTPGFIRKLGFKELKPINYISIKNVKIEKTKKERFRVSYFPEDASILWEKYASKLKFKIRLDRTANYIRWRYKFNPLFKYITLYSPNKYFIVFKKFHKTLHIIDFFGTSSELNKNLIDNAFQLAKKSSCSEISMWIPKNHPIIKILKKHSIEKLHANSFMLVKSLNKKLSRKLFNLNNWYYTMGDTDIF